MDFTLAPTAKRNFAGVADWQREVAAADHPRLRMFTAEWTMRESPQREVAGRWSVCTPANAADFSAVAYYFGRTLLQTLDVPVGLITCAYGASTIESWIREPALRAHPQFKGLLDAFAKKRLAFRDEKDVHPRNKLDVGNRLARLALVGTYGKPGVARGPLFRDAAPEGNRIRVRFQRGGGSLQAPNGPLRGFVIAGADRNFVQADAVVDGDSVLVSNPAVAQPAHVRYAWADNPVGANLTNAEGLPAAPFRTDL